MRSATFPLPSSFRSLTDQHTSVNTVQNVWMGTNPSFVLPFSICLLRIAAQKFQLNVNLCPEIRKLRPIRRVFGNNGEPPNSNRVRAFHRAPAASPRCHNLERGIDQVTNDRRWREDCREITTCSEFVAPSLRIPYTLEGLDCRSINPRENGPFRSILPAILCHRVHR